MDDDASDSTRDPSKSLRERLGVNAEERLGKALSELLESPLFTGAIGRAFDAREKAVQAQEVALGALNLPSAADIERLTRRVRAVTHRLEGIEEGVGRLDSTLSPRGLETRLAAIDEKLETLSAKLDAAIGVLEGKSAADGKAGAIDAKAGTKARAKARSKTT